MMQSPPSPAYYNSSSWDGEIMFQLSVLTKVILLTSLLSVCLVLCSVVKVNKNEDIYSDIYSGGNIPYVLLISTIESRSVVSRAAIGIGVLYADNGYRLVATSTWPRSEAHACRSSISEFSPMRRRA